MLSYLHTFLSLGHLLSVLLSSAWDLCLLMESRGVLAKPTHGTIIRFAPPLIMTDAELDECLQIIDSCLNEIKDLPRTKV